MKIIDVEDINNSKYDVDWGNGTSRRMLVDKDAMGYTVTYTTVNRSSKSFLQYDNHLESCFVISGKGAITDTNGNKHELYPGVLYVLDKHDPHYLEAYSHQDLVLLSIFNPPLEGTEVHSLDHNGASSY